MLWCEPLVGIQEPETPTLFFPGSKLHDLRHHSGLGREHTGVQGLLISPFFPPALTPKPEEEKEAFCEEEGDLPIKILSLLVEAFL